MFWVGLVIGWAIGGLVTVAVLALFMGVSDRRTRRSEEKPSTNGHRRWSK